MTLISLLSCFSICSITGALAMVTRVMREILACIGEGPVIAIGLSQVSKDLFLLASREPDALAGIVTVGTPTGTQRYWPEKALRQRAAIIAGDYTDFDEFVSDFACRIYPEKEAKDLAEEYVSAMLKLPRSVFRDFLAAS